MPQEEQQHRDGCNWPRLFREVPALLECCRFGPLEEDLMIFFLPGAGAIATSSHLQNGQRPFRWPKSLPASLPCLPSGCDAVDPRMQSLRTRFSGRSGALGSTGRSGGLGSTGRSRGHNGCGTSGKAARGALRSSGRSLNAALRTSHRARAYA